MAGDPRIRRRNALDVVARSDVQRVTWNFDKLLERQLQLLDAATSVPHGYADWPALHTSRRFDHGLAHLVALGRTRTRDAEIAAYVERVRSEDDEPEPEPPGLLRRCDDARLGRLPESVERALPRETRAGPPAAQPAADPGDDEGPHDPARPR